MLVEFRPFCRLAGNGQRVAFSAKNSTRLPLRALRVMISSWPDSTDHDQPDRLPIFPGNRSWLLQMATIGNSPRRMQVSKCPAITLVTALLSPRSRLAVRLKRRCPPEGKPIRHSKEMPRSYQRRGTAERTIRPSHQSPHQISAASQWALGTTSRWNCPSRSAVMRDVSPCRTEEPEERCGAHQTNPHYPSRLRYCDSGAI